MGHTHHTCLAHDGTSVNTFSRLPRITSMYPNVVEQNASRSVVLKLERASKSPGPTSKVSDSARIGWGQSRGPKGESIFLLIWVVAQIVFLEGTEVHFLVGGQLKAIPSFQSPLNSLAPGPFPPFSRLELAGEILFTLYLFDPSIIASLCEGNKERFSTFKDACD